MQPVNERVIMKEHSDNITVESYSNEYVQLQEGIAKAELTTRRKSNFYW